MPVQLSCRCGRQYKVPEQHAGKRTKCPACGTALTVPKPKPDEEEVIEADVVEDDVVEADVAEDDVAEAEVVEDEDEVVEAEVEDDVVEAEIEVVEEDDDVVTDVEVVKEDEGRKGKKKKRPKRADREGALSRMYMAEAHDQMRRDELRAGGGRRGDDDEGMTIGGVHLTAGVVGGASMLFVGLLCMLLILIFKNDEEVFLGPRVFIGAVVCTGVGLLTLVKSIFFGEED